MKKSSLAAAVSALVLSGLMLSGCGMFRSHKAWDKARQESPLEIPPGLDTPSASEALVIPPPGANQPTANGATAATSGAEATITDGFVLADSVDNTYQRLGQALEGGSLGQLTAHDDAAHSYSLDVSGVTMPGKKGSFFGRMFGGKSGEDAASTTLHTHAVQITVSPSGDNGSEVRAQGNAAAVAKVIDALRSRMGG